MPCDLHFVPQGMDKVTYKKGVGPAYLIKSDGESIERVRGTEEIEVPFFLLSVQVPYNPEEDPQEAFSLTFDKTIGRLSKCLAALSRTFNELEEGSSNPGHMDLFIEQGHPYVHTWGNTKADRVAAFDPFVQRAKARVIMGGDTARGWVVKLKVGLIARGAIGPVEPGMFDLEKVKVIDPPAYQRGMSVEQIMPLVRCEILAILKGEVE